MPRRTTSYPFRKTRDLSPEIRQRILEDEQKLADTRAKLAAEQRSEPQLCSAQLPSSAFSGTALSERGDFASRITSSAPTSSIQPPTSRTAMPTHPSELQNEINNAPSAIPGAPPTRPKSPAETRLRGAAAPGFIHHPPDLARHSRKCSICRHPERETIEDLFIHWHSPNTIANFFDDTADDAEDAGDDSANRLRITWVAIYRHAYAVGLDEIRRRNLRFAFEHILEQAGDITPTSASIMAAARAYAACVNNDGHWNDPPKRVIVTNIRKREADSPDSALPFEAPVGAASRRPPFSECGVSTPPCHTTSQWQDADSPVAPSGVHSDSTPSLTNHGTPATEHGSPATGHEPVMSSEIRIPPNSLITNGRKIYNR